MPQIDANQAAIAVHNPLAVLSRDHLITEVATAEILGITPQHLRCSRMKKPSWDGPPFVVVGKAAIRYRVGALFDWIDSRTVNPADRLRKAS